MEAHCYAAIDLKSYFASVECSDRALDPLRTNLVVADETRTDKTIVLAVSPSMKAYGIPGRPRLFEVTQKLREVNARRLQEAVRAGKLARGSGFISSSFDADALKDDLSLEVSTIIAPPRMARYVEVSAQIYAIYLKYVAPEDCHIYSIDEVFIDLTPSLKLFGMSARELTMCMIREVLYTTGITATAGIGTNLYLAKIAMDIVAKKMPADENGVRMAELNERDFRELLWDHKPLTDFWRIGSGTARRLEKHYITTMGEIARHSLCEPEWFYKSFGVDAELLIDQAWGIERCGMSDIKNYKTQTNSYSEGQVLPEPYSYERARIIVREMADAMVMRLARHEMLSDSLSLYVGYDRESLTAGRAQHYAGAVTLDHYGRAVPKPVNGSVRLKTPSNLGSKIIPAILEIYDRIVDKSLLLRRINVCAGNCKKDEGACQLDFFTDFEAEQRERSLQKAMLDIRSRFGKNAILRGTSYQSGATMRERNGMIGGHQANSAAWASVQERDADEQE